MGEPVMQVIIALPPEIDITNASDVLELITAACAPGVPVVIADLTGTSFCDSAGLQHLIKAAASGTELRLAIAPGGEVSRIRASARPVQGCPAGSRGRLRWPVAAPA